MFLQYHLTAKPLISREKFAKDLGKRIREIRSKKGISLKTFESLDNSIDRHALSRIENGSTLPSLYRIAMILAVNVKDFFPDDTGW